MIVMHDEQVALAVLGRHHDHIAAGGNIVPLVDDVRVDYGMDLMRAIRVVRLAYHHQQQRRCLARWIADNYADYIAGSRDRQSLARQVIRQQRCGIMDIRAAIDMAYGLLT